MSNIRDIAQQLYEDAQRRTIFWHYAMPINYKTHRVYQGLNFAILGLEHKTLIDNRWGLTQDFLDENIGIREDAPVHNIMYWKKEYNAVSLYPIAVFNVSDTEDYSRYTNIKEQVHLLEFLNQYRIPYVESDNPSYSPLENVLYLNTHTDNNDEENIRLNESLPAIAKWIVGNYEWEKEPCLKKLNKNKFSIPNYLFLLQDLVMYKLAYTLGIKIHQCIDNDLLCDSITYFYNNSRKTILLSVFIVADLIVNNFLNKKTVSNDIMKEFMSDDYAYNLLRTLSRQELLLLQKCMTLSKSATDNNIAFLHYYNFDENGSVNFYVTAYDENEDEETIKGYIQIDDQEPHFKCYTPWDLSSEMEIDSLFRPNKISELL